MVLTVQPFFVCAAQRLKLLGVYKEKTGILTAGDISLVSPV